MKVKVKIIKMGKNGSKIKTTGDSTVEVNNVLEQHQTFHEEHAFKLWLILVLVSIQVIFLAYNQIKTMNRRNAMKAAKSIANLQV